MNQPMRGLFGLLAGLTVAVSPVVGVRAADQGGHSSHEGMTHDMGSMPSMAKLHQSAGRQFEVAFLSEMIEHHRGGIQMSEMTLKRAKRPEVRQAAQKVIADQKKESAQMRSWLRSWYRQGPRAELQALVKKDSAPMMSAFRKECQTDCDRAFLTHMTHHHQMGAHMAQMAVEKSTHAPLRRLAQKMVKEQQAEAEKFQRLLHQSH